MKYSLINGEKIEAFPSGKGLCICCNKETIAKCGNKVIHHWAHKSSENCDNWWENETEWHRRWKDNFPKAWQEVIHYDQNTGEKHIADVKTSKGVVIELQNSPMSTMELQSREEFYKNMVWIINGKKFMNQFYILDKLPNPEIEFFNDIVIYPRKYNQKGRLYYRLSENSENSKMVLIHSIDEIIEQIEKYYIGHHQFDWIKPRTVWYDAKCPVFFDFGEDTLWKLLIYKNKYWSVKKIFKKYFVQRALLSK